MLVKFVKKEIYNEVMKSKWPCAEMHSKYVIDGGDVLPLEDRQTFVHQNLTFKGEKSTCSTHRPINKMTIFCYVNDTLQFRDTETKAKLHKA